MSKTIVRLAGDGVGPEVMAAAARVLDAAAERFRLELDYIDMPFGGAAGEAASAPLPVDTLEACLSADAVLLGAVGGPQFDALPPEQRPETGLLALRRALGVYANLRPVACHAAGAARSPFREGHLDGVDILFVRELTGGAYFGAKTEGDGFARDDWIYTEEEIARMVRRAGAAARRRKGRVTSVDKANVLATSRLWRRVATRVMAEEFPDVALEHMLVDAMAMALIARPRDFDVVVSENLFGDILTDEASMLAGSIGLLPSASLGEGTHGLYEPVHGSAPDIAGENRANPVGMILSAAMMLEMSLDAPEAARAVRNAVDRALAGGALTADLGGEMGCAAMGAAIAQRLDTA
ncbi:MAG: 3-isopropylmalate dehydrogenase [Parvularculaceae bacterium]